MFGDSTTNVDAGKTPRIVAALGSVFTGWRPFGVGGCGAFGQAVWLALARSRDGAVRRRQSAAAWNAVMTAGISTGIKAISGTIMAAT
jgi:hypothetical protein